MSDIVRLLIRVRNTPWAEPNSNYKNNPELRMYMALLKDVPEDDLCDMSKPILDINVFCPETCLDTILYQYAAAFCQLTIHGQELAEGESYHAFNHRYPLKRMWLNKKNEFEPVSTVPDIWLPSRIYQELSDNQSNLSWLNIQWKGVRVKGLHEHSVKQMKMEPPMVNPKKSPITPGM